MSGDKLFSEGISRIRTLLRIHAILQFLWIGSAIFLLLFAVRAGIEKMGIFHGARTGLFDAIAVGTAIFLSSLYAWIGRKSFLNRLIEIDTRLKLQDRISTAFEYRRLEIRSDWVDSLLADAGRCVGSLDSGQIVPKRLSPKRLSWTHLLLPVSILLNLVIGSIEPASHASVEDRIDLQTSDRLHALAQQYASVRPRRNPGSEGVGKIEREIENLTRRIEDPSASRSSLRQALNRMLKEVRNENALLSKELTAKLEAEGIEDLPGLKMRRAEGFSLYQLKRLDAVLDRLFENQVPEAITRDMAALVEHHQIDRFLEELIDRLENPDSTAAASRSETSEAGLPDPSRRERQGRAGSRTQIDPKGTRAESGRERSEGEQAGGVPAEDDASTGSDEELSSTPGRGKSQAPPGSPYPLDKAKGPAVQDRTLPAQKEDYSVHIRSLTGIGRAREKSDDFSRSYRQEMEAILQKEEIPENYKDYIKNYFLSIGLGKEKGGP